MQNLKYINVIIRLETTPLSLGKETGQVQRRLEPLDLS